MWLELLENHLHLRKAHQYDQYVWILLRKSKCAQSAMCNERRKMNSHFSENSWDRHLPLRGYGDLQTSSVFFLPSTNIYIYIHMYKVIYLIWIFISIYHVYMYIYIYVVIYICMYIRYLDPVDCGHTKAKMDQFCLQKNSWKAIPTPEHSPACFLNASERFWRFWTLFEYFWALV